MLTGAALRAFASVHSKRISSAVDRLATQLPELGSKEPVAGIFSDDQAFRQHAIMVRRELASYFEDLLFQGGIHQFDNGVLTHRSANPAATLLSIGGHR